MLKMISLLKKTTNDIKSKWSENKIKPANYNTAFSIFYGLLLYAGKFVISLLLEKRILKQFH